MAKRIIVGMSGGVDSSVAALLLKEQGYDVLGVFMKNWEEKDDSGLCTATQDYEDVRAVCDEIGIPYYTVNFTREYWDRVFSHFLEEYQRGRTPNPDVLCNREIKFRAFLDFAMKNGADGIATGHFCQLDKTDGRVRLLRGADSNKDQTYFLYMLSQEQLRNAMFPVGHLTKAEVRQIAREHGLDTAEKKDSTGVCFIGERNFKKFLSGFLPAQPGDMVTPEGEIVGHHDGLMYYTLGQRKGLGISLGCHAFVRRINAAENTVELTTEESRLFRRTIFADDLNWIAIEDLHGPLEVEAKIRYAHRAAAAVISPCPIPGTVRVDFMEAQRAPAPGQAVVFYRDGSVIGGGTILDMEEPIC